MGCIWGQVPLNLDPTSDLFRPAASFSSTRLPAFNLATRHAPRQHLHPAPPPPTTETQNKKNMDDRASSNALLSPGEELSPQEQEVIDEYVRLADNMKKARHARKLRVLMGIPQSTLPNLPRFFQILSLSYQPIPCLSLTRVSVLHMCS